MNLLVWATSAMALTYEDSSMGTVHGWTADGALVFEITTHVALRNPDYWNNPTPVRGTLRYVVMQQGDKVLFRWLLAKELPPHADNKEPLQADAWAIWLLNSGGPLPAFSSRSTPSGVRLEVRRAERVRSEWHGASAQVVGSYAFVDAVDPIVSIGLSNRGEGFWTLYQRPIEVASVQDSLELAVAGYWSADWRHVALSVERRELDTMWGTELPSLEVVLAPAAPLIGMLAPASVEGAVLDRVEAAVRDLGPVQRAPAKAERAVSVIYAATGYEADARAIASRIPGGATVEPMSWPAPQHVIVAVGASARQP